MKWGKVLERPSACPRSPGESAARLHSKDTDPWGQAAWNGLGLWPREDMNKLLDRSTSIDVTSKTNHNLCNELHLHIIRIKNNICTISNGISCPVSKQYNFQWQKAELDLKLQAYLFYCASLYWTSQILHFLQTEDKTLHQLRDRLPALLRSAPKSAIPLRCACTHFSVFVTIVWHQATESLISSFIFIDNNKQILTFLNITYIKDWVLMKVWMLYIITLSDFKVKIFYILPLR